MVKIITAIALALLLCPAAVYCQTGGEKPMNKPQGKVPVIFATFAETEEGIDHAYFLAESIRQFAGSMKDAPIRLYLADYNNLDYDATVDRFKPLGVEVTSSSAPEEAFWLYYTGKVYGAGLAEKQAEGQTDVLVWMDDDTIIFKEPTDLRLAPDISFGYRPIMHNKSGSLYDEPPDEFWGRIYKVLKIKDEDLFPMMTVVDDQKIRAYFNAGLLVVRPGRGILRKWSKDYAALYRDPVIAEMCRASVNHKIFLHQTALTGAVLNSIKQDQMIELSDKYNYPLFFEQMYGADKAYNSIDDIITMRYEAYFRKPDPEWESKLSGPPEKVAWIKERLGK